MNDDYLWDKSGEPDPQIQQLEEILGTLRYQPRPLEFPKELNAPRRKNYVPLLAIAATLLVALLAAALWLALHNSGPVPPQQVKAPQPSAPSVVPRESPVPELVRNEAPGQPPAPKRYIAKVRPRTTPSEPRMSSTERQQAVAAKEQLMLALRVASEKLNQAQRRVQSPATPNQIRNQHKVG